LDFGFWIVNEQQFKTRTKPLALRVIRLVTSLPVASIKTLRQKPKS